MATTYKEILELFKETDRQFKESERKLIEADKRLSEQFANQIAESRKAAQERQREAEERWQREANERQREAEARQRDFEKEQKALQEAQKRTDRALGKLGNRLGDWVEEMVKPACVRMFHELGIDVHQTFQGVEVKRDGEGLEMDLFVVNRTDAIAVECKSQLLIADIDEHLERMGKIKRMMPQYVGLKLMGAVAGMAVSESAARYAEREGLFVIAPADDMVRIINAEGFEAQAW